MTTERWRAGIMAGWILLVPPVQGMIESAGSPDAQGDELKVIGGLMAVHPTLPAPADGSGWLRRLVLGNPVALSRWWQHAAFDTARECEERLKAERPPMARCVPAEALY